MEVTASGCRDELDELVYRQESPFLGPSIYAQRCVFRRANELGLKVMLDGQGADELLGGYDWAVPRAIAAMTHGCGWLRAFGEAWALSGSRFPFHRVVLQALRCRLRPHEGELPDNLRSAVRASFENVSLPGLLEHADRNSMSFGVETRLPWLDHRLIEAASLLRPEDLVGGGHTKAIVRRAMKGRLPPELLLRKDKMAFNVPEARWIRNELAESVQEAVRYCFWAELDCPGMDDFLETALGEVQGGPYNRRSWKVLSVYRWHRRFFG